MKHPGRYSMRFSFFFLIAIMSLGFSNAHADIIIDNGGGGTSSTGTWELSGGTSPYGANSLWARDGAIYRWQFTSQPAGTYEVFMWWSGWSSRATNVPVTIVHRDGSNTVNVNQLQNAGKWNSLGQYYFNGTGTVSIRAANGSTVSTCADAVRFVNVGGGVNQPPTAANDTAVTAEGSPVTVNVVSNDTDDGGVDASTVAVVGAPANGTAVPNGNGTITYTPNFGITGVDTFTYTVADAQGAMSNPATVTVTVNAVSAETVIDNGGPGTSSTGTWAVSGATGSYGSPSVWSRDGTKFTWTFTPFTSGSYELSMWWTAFSSRSTSVPVDIRHTGGTARVTINQQQNGGRWNVLGRYTFAAGRSYTVTITSQPGPSSTCADAVKFTFLADVENLPPTAVNDTAATSMNTPVTVDVVSNDTDDGGISAATVAIVTPPANGTAVPNGNGTVTYTPDEAYTGADMFTYTVADSQGAMSNPATVSVTVNAENVSPVAANDIATTVMNTPVTVNVLSNDTDDGGINAASVLIVASPVSGTAVSNGNGTVTYTPAAGFTGAEAFAYTVADAQGAVSNQATITVTVNAASAEVVIDTGGSGTSYTGSWAASGASGSYGTNSLWSRDGATYTWSFTPAVSGTYDVSMWWTTWSSRSTAIPVDIRHAGGTTRVVINQQQNGGNWNSLGLYPLASGIHYTVMITSQPGPTSTCADAVKFTNVGGVGNIPPTAVIDSISPNPAVPGGNVDFSGRGVEVDGGEIFAYSWRSSIDGVISTSASFSTSSLSTGQHTIYFRVQDDLGAWSTEASMHLDVTNQALNTENIYLILLYGADNKESAYVTLLQSQGGYLEGDTWKYSNLSTGKKYSIRFIRDMEAGKLAFYDENATIILAGHSNYGMGGFLRKPGETNVDINYIDDVKIWNYSSPWMGISVRGMITGQPYPNWWPEFQDGTSGIMPYDFNDPRGNPPHNYIMTYQVPGDPTYYKTETVRSGALERFPDSGATPWYSPDGSSPSASNPAHREYFITNANPADDSKFCGASPCPKPHYGSRTILFRKDLEIDQSRMKYKRMMIDTCSSGQYYLDTFNKGVVFFTLGTVDSNGGLFFLKDILDGKTDQEIGSHMGEYYFSLSDYFDFNKQPQDQ